MNILKKLLIVFILTIGINAQKATLDQIVGSAYTSNKGYQFLERASDETGGRLMGSVGNKKGVEILKEELKKIGIQAREESFVAPGWRRGDDKLTITQPFEKQITAFALGYTEKEAPFTAEVVYASFGDTSDYAGISAEGKIVVVTQEAPPAPRKSMIRQEVIRIATLNKARAVLFTYAERGGRVMVGTGDFHGRPLKVPAFTLPYEVGKMLVRLIQSGKKVEMNIDVQSYCVSADTVSNVVVTLPGKSDKKIVVGAHYDSWDLGTGAIDNGLGSAILFDVARLLKETGKTYDYTIEFVWFNGEEFGLFGSSNYAKKHKDENMVAMINMDMVGTPNGWNLMGFDDYRKSFEAALNNFAGFDLTVGVRSTPWSNSDHVPFMVQGVPVFTPSASLAPGQGETYHNFLDTFDKVKRDQLSAAAGFVAGTLHLLMTDASMQFKKMPKDQLHQMLKKNNLFDLLVTQGWI